MQSFSKLLQLRQTVPFEKIMPENLEDCVLKSEEYANAYIQSSNEYCANICMFNYPGAIMSTSPGHLQPCYSICLDVFSVFMSCAVPKSSGKVWMYTIHSTKNFCCESNDSTFPSEVLKLIF